MTKLKSLKDDMYRYHGGLGPTFVSRVKNSAFQVTKIRARSCMNA